MAVISLILNNLKKPKIFLSTLFLIGLYLRFLYFPGHIFFNYEQGRDLLIVRDIVENHKFTLIGPKTDTGGIFHGPIYYYLLTIPYLLSNGNPVFISFFLILISCLSIPFIYLLVKELGDGTQALTAAILMTFSFGSTIYSRWFANPPLAIPFLILLLFSIIKVTKGNQKYLCLVAISTGFIIQFEIVSIILLVPFYLYVLIFTRIRKSLKNIPVLLLSIFLLLIFLSTYVIFDLRHQFLMTNSFVTLLKGSGVGGKIDFAKSLNFLFEEFQFWVLPYFPILISSVLACIALLFVRTKIIYVFCVSVFLMASLFPSFILKHFFLTIGPVFIVMLGLTLGKIKNNLLVIIGICFILMVNIVAFRNQLIKNEGVFFQIGQREMYLKDQIKVIDYIYQNEKGGDFSIHPYTIPYFKTEGWQYLFKWYGEKKYGYLPKEVDSKIFYLIVQPDEGQVWFYTHWYNQEIVGNKQLESKKIGIINVEKRLVNEN